MLLVWLIVLLRALFVVLRLVILICWLAFGWFVVGCYVLLIFVSCCWFVYGVGDLLFDYFDLTIISFIMSLGLVLVLLFC